MIRLSRNGSEVYSFTPLYEGMPIVVAIDSSKSNTGMIVGDLEGHVYDDYEISGSGNDTDVYDLCKVTRTQLKQLFRGAKIQCVGIENIITKSYKKDSKYGGAMDIHQSRYKITAVFDNFIFSFQEFFDIMPELINNNSWKYNTLPEEYRKRTHHKGSKEYMDTLGTRFSGRRDDVTDAYFIYQYIINTHTFNYVKPVDFIAPCNAKYDYIIIPNQCDIAGATKYEIANTGNFEQNVATIASILKPGDVGQFQWDIDEIPEDIIFSDKVKVIGTNVFSYRDTTAAIGVYLSE